MLDMSKLTLEDVTGRLRMVEDRPDAAPEKKKEGGKLLLTEEEWTARLKEKRRSGEGSSKFGGGRGGDKPRGKKPADKQKKKGWDPKGCRKCGKSGHWAKECPGKKPEKKEEAHLARDDSDDECALLMGEYCALQEGEAGEMDAEQGSEPGLRHPGPGMTSPRAVDLEEPGLRHPGPGMTSPRSVDLDEPHARVLLGEVGDDQEQRWYLDSGASNHMTGCRAAFSDLDENKTGSVKFGDGSRVTIRGQGTVLFRCKNGEQRALTDVYFIPQLRSSIVSLGQLDERGSEVLIKDGVLRIRDRERRLLAKVTRSRNRLYLLDLKVEQPVCLAAQGGQEAWLWHARFGHLSFEALGRLGEMVRGLPHIDHVGELCDSCLVGKQRRSAFPKAAKYRAKEKLELVHGDLCGPITPATHGGRRYFILLVDDYSRYMWLQLLTSKD
jgi:hypothetical protein